MSPETEVVSQVVTDATQTVQPPSEAPPPAEVAKEPAVDPLEAKYQAKILALESNLKSIQRTVNKKDDELKQASDFRAEIAQLKEEIRLNNLYATERLKIMQDETLTPDEQARKLHEQDSLLERQREQVAFVKKLNEYAARTVALGLTEDDDDYWTIKDAAENGKFDRAEAKLKQVERKKQPKEEKKVAETTKEKPLTPEDEESIFQEVARRKGLTFQELGKPSSPAKRTYTRQQIDFMPPEEYKVLQAEIQLAADQGKVK
ncbi:MAG: hypothetical protein UW18_C0014G0002 [Microgenomates group bacterium GW2011_GWF1_44_10]|nr:MAG: hypothetical protein UW18_C0014G0002 [Microgenomates group bacterium GW2011_GWF1_44_10]